MSVPEISVKPLGVEDAEALFSFEIRNREWFEKWVGPRTDDYREQSLLRGLIARQVSEAEPMFLIWQGSEIVGRINLTGIEAGVGQLGYRVGENFAGQGIATMAVRQVLGWAADHGLWALEARVVSDNPASKSVLLKSGFRAVHDEPLDERMLTLFRIDLD